MRARVPTIALTIALAAFGLTVTASPAAAAKPKCFGKKATKVLGNGGVFHVGTDGNDVIVGGKGDDEISGGDGNDRICGRGGEDVINGEGDKDKMSGDGGNDAVNGADGVTAEVIDGAGGNDICNFDAGDTFRSCEIVPCMRLSGPPERVCRGAATAPARTAET